MYLWSPLFTVNTPYNWIPRSVLNLCTYHLPPSVRRVASVTMWLFVSVRWAWPLRSVDHLACDTHRFALCALPSQPTLFAFSRLQHNNGWARTVRAFNSVAFEVYNRLPSYANTRFVALNRTSAVGEDRHGHFESDASVDPANIQTNTTFKNI